METYYLTPELQGALWLEHKGIALLDEFYFLEV